MEAKIGSVAVAGVGGRLETVLQAAAGVREGKPAGVVVVRGTLEGREVVIVASAQEAIELSSALVVAAAASMGVQPVAVELAPPQTNNGGSALRIVKH